MASKQFKKNQVVWAKLKGYPWWPSCISQVGTTDVVVNFLGENTHATIKLDQVHDFKENYSQYIKNVNERNKKLKQAVDIGLRISEGKSSYEAAIPFFEPILQSSSQFSNERKSMERKYQMEEEEDDDNQSSSESAAKNSKKAKKGAVTNKLSNEISLNKTVSTTSTGKKTPKKGVKPTSKSSTKASAESESKNGGNDKLVPENAGEPSLAASEKELATINTRSTQGKKQQKISEKQTRRNSQNMNKNSSNNNVTINPEFGIEELVDTEPSHLLSNPIHEKEMNSTEQLAQFNKNENSMEKSSSNHINESEQKELEEDHQEMNLEKATKKSAASANGSPRNGFAEDKRDIYTNNSNAHNSSSNNQNQSSDSNLQSQNGQNNQQKSAQNGQSQSTNKRNKRSVAQKNGSAAANNNNLNIQIPTEAANQNEIIDSPKKKLKTNQIKSYNTNPQDATELQQSLEAILEIFQNQKSSNIFKLSEIKDLDHLSDAYFSLNIPTMEFFNTKVGKLFVQHLQLVTQYKHSEDFMPEIKQKLEVVVEHIRDKILTETLGSEIKELIFKKKVQINGNCVIQNEVEDEKSIHSNTQLNKQITSHTKLNGDLVVGQEKEAEDPKKLRDQQLRKKICKKINELLKENYGLEKAQAQDLCVQIERKIKSVQVELNHDYKNNVKGLIRLLKAKEISIDKLQKCNVDELIQVIQHENIQAELKSLGVPQFEKNSSLANNSD
ncbi:PWWP domain protein (macronuclear) [Tetrahymena thermophila SB210]|uniref:PWWP domain protein n=1 Tax=Tetrahymena thermophila (strain SB210) TaxID=312017 RepID=I7LUV4_TETTS|nr:PWWP domain protein [Tetrahymena thermophila SB210]EAR96117.2 PWWP domain protein [Tetrahymena thermophila SB210]|eukprot:XP_001016362.2 PWWP domain protein [Tetrahymena thermophila SB210]